MSEQEDPKGILAIDKPAGWTSMDVVAVARGTLGVRRVGHGGTPDPMATGLLAVLVGPATKVMARPHEAPKGYAAVVRLRSETTTADAQGGATRPSAPPPPPGAAAAPPA